MTEETTNNGVELSVDLGDLQEYIGIDYDMFSGMKSKVSEAKIMDYGIATNPYTKKEERNVSLVLVTDVLNPEEPENPIQAREYVRLRESRTEQGKWEYSTNANSTAKAMLDFFKVRHIKDIVGREVTVLKKLKANGAERLGFNYGD